MTRKPRTTPSFVQLKPASESTSRVARASSRKRDTKPELLLRRACFALGLRYRIDVADLPGRPDMVFSRARLAVFIDGDYWHGRDLEERTKKLEAGHNAEYWVAKIKGNVARDRRHDEMLRAQGWMVLRFWERDVLAAPETCAALIRAAVMQSDR